MSCGLFFASVLRSILPVVVLGNLGQLRELPRRQIQPGVDLAKPARLIRRRYRGEDFRRFAADRHRDRVDETEQRSGERRKAPRRATGMRHLRLCW